MSTQEDTDEPIEELILPGLVENPSAIAAKPTPAAKTSQDQENLDDVEETLSERLYGLTEMFPPTVISLVGRGWVWSYWLVRRSAWVLGTSLALLALPPFIEQQRLEIEEMQNSQRKQMMLGQGQGPGLSQPSMMPMQH